MIPSNGCMRECEKEVNTVEIVTHEYNLSFVKIIFESNTALSNTSTLRFRESGIQR